MLSPNNFLALSKIPLHLLPFMARFAILTSSSLSFCSIMTVEKLRSGVFPEEEDETRDREPHTCFQDMGEADRHANPLQLEVCTKIKIVSEDLQAKNEICDN